MLRTTVIFAATAAMLLAGCGKSSPTSSYNELAHVTATPSPTTYNGQPIATGVDASTVVTETGSVSLGLNALKDPSNTIASLTVSLAGNGLTQPLSKQLTPSDFATSNTLAFDHIPATTLTATITAFDKNNTQIGTQSTSINVAPNNTTKMQLGLTAAPFGFQEVDPNAILPATQDDTTPVTGDTTGTTGVSAQTGTTDTGAAAGALSVEILSKDVERKYLLFKRLSVTVRVTNHNAANALNGEVVVDFHKTSGIFTKTDSVVQTLTQDVTNLAPGQSVDVTLESTTSADDAAATVHTVVASSTAS